MLRLRETFARPQSLGALGHLASRLSGARKDRRGPTPRHAELCYTRRQDKPERNIHEQPTIHR